MEHADVHLLGRDRVWGQPRRWRQHFFGKVGIYLHFSPEDGGSVCLRNVTTHKPTPHYNPEE
jgi:hypothetical protein